MRKDGYVRLLYMFKRHKRWIIQALKAWGWLKSTGSGNSSRQMMRKLILPIERAGIAIYIYIYID